MLLYINGRRQQVAGNDAFLSLSDYLRLRLGLTGTKIVCSEGDCGSCTVLIGRRRDGRSLRLPPGRLLHPVDVPARWHARRHRRRARRRQWRELTPVQQAMIECHGSQCGFCTPGFVVAMTGLLEEHDDTGRRGLAAAA